MTKGKHLRERGPIPKLTDSEVVTIKVVEKYLGLSQDSELFDYFRRYCIHCFPAMLQINQGPLWVMQPNLWAIKERLRCILVTASCSTIRRCQLSIVYRLRSVSLRAYCCHRFDDIGSFGKDYTC